MRKEARMANGKTESRSADGATRGPKWETAKARKASVASEEK